MGATFAGTRSVVANTRQVDDSLNGVAGGCAAGFLAGIRCMFTLPPYPIVELADGLSIALYLILSSTFSPNGRRFLRCPCSPCGDIRVHRGIAAGRYVLVVVRGETEAVLQARTTTSCRSCSSDRRRYVRFGLDSTNLSSLLQFYFPLSCSEDAMDRSAVVQEQNTDQKYRTHGNHRIQKSPSRWVKKIRWSQCLGRSERFTTVGMP